MYAWIKTYEKWGFLGLSPADRRRHDDRHKHTVGILTLDFLMGRSDSGFKASFEWVFQEDHLLKLLEGQYYTPMTPRQRADQQAQVEETTQEKILTDLRHRQRVQNLPTAWIEGQARALSYLGGQQYQSWFKTLEFGGVVNGVVHLITPSAFMRDHLPSDPTLRRALDLLCQGFGPSISYKLQVRSEKETLFN